MRRPRLSIRQWMIAIAVMATLFGIYMHQRLDRRHRPVTVSTSSAADR
jgi:hypothetical protein